MCSYDVQVAENDTIIGALELKGKRKIILCVLYVISVLLFVYEVSDMNKIKYFL
jgi:hypothetical protein